MLWAGVNLRRRAVAVVTAGAISGDAVVLLHLEAVGNAVTDLSFFGAVLAVTAVVAVMTVRPG